MTFLLDMLYLVAGVLAMPWLLLKSYRTGKYRSDFGARFGRVKNPRPLEPEGYESLKHKGQSPLRLMLHCVSVGELLSTRLLVDRLLLAEPRLHLIITTTTDTGTARAREIYGKTHYQTRVSTHRYPLDFSFAVRGFLSAVSPDAIALVELETWPNFIRIARRRNIPVCIINGRITDRSFKRYRLIYPVMRRMLRRMSWITAQTQTIARRFALLGAPAERLTVMPTLKYDAADFGEVSPAAGPLAAATGIVPEHLLVVGGSVAPGEDIALLDAYDALREEYPQLRLALAPRRPEHARVMQKAIAARGLYPVLRSQHPDGATRLPLTAGEVLLLDTLGELKTLYRLSFAVFVGRSLVPLGGSDMIEAAALAKPCCFGPHIENFMQVVDLLTGNNAAVMIASPEALTTLLRHFLANPAEAAALGRRARELLAAQRGTTDRTVRMLLEMLAAKPPTRIGAEAAAMAQSA